MKWSNVRLLFVRELRDQLRDRRTIFTIAVLPMLLYPLLGMSFLQIAQFTREHPSRVLIVGTKGLPATPELMSETQQAFATDLVAPTHGPMFQLRIEDGESPTTETEIAEVAKRRIQSGEFDVVIFFPPQFGEELGRFRSDLLQARKDALAEIKDNSFKIPEPKVFVDTASDKSRIASVRVEGILRRWREKIVNENLKESNLPATVTAPFEVAERDVSKVESRRAAMWSKILPFVVLVWSLTGAFYPAVDLCAGEKERGTLETLLSSPADRSEIVWGKLLTVMTFSIGTSLLNMLSMGGTGTFIMRQMNQLGTASSALDFGQPPLSALFWLGLAVIPISALFSALSLSVAAFARSSKEGQYYLMPLLMISLPLMLLPMKPSTELDLGTSLIPITGIMLLLKALIEGQYWDAFRFAIPVVTVTGFCCMLAIRWAIDQFSNESVLFRETERFSLGAWLKHLVRDRQDLPTASGAVFCGVLLLVLHFVASVVVKAPQSWAGFAYLTVGNLVLLIAGPAVLMAVLFTRRPAQTLLIQMPDWRVLPKVLLLAIIIHPITTAFARFVAWIYPLSPDVTAYVKSFEGLLGASPSIWAILGVLAITPAICEELAFRGFILSGLRRTRHPWMAIVLSSVFFGAAHGVLQQSISATALGILIGWLAIRTNSILPGMLFHACYNSVNLLMAFSGEAITSEKSIWRFFVTISEQGIQYNLFIVVLAGIGTILTLGWITNPSAMRTKFRSARFSWPLAAKAVVLGSIAETR